MRHEAALILVAPSLLGPELPAGADRTACEALTAGLEVPALETLLTRGEAIAGVSATDGAQDAHDVAGLLFTLFGHRHVSGQDWPAAAVALVGEGRDPGEDWWLRADPVHLRPDLGDLILIEGASLGVTLDDARGLVEPLAAHFAADGMRFEIAAPDRWYLSAPGPHRIVTRPLSAVAGRPVSAALPGGADARRWHRLLNEAQMVLHDCEANRARAARGLAPINSVWPWGGGFAPGTVRARFTVVHGDDPLLRGLAAGTGLDCRPLSQAGALLSGAMRGHVLVLEQSALAPARATDVERWRDAVNALEQAWLAPALAALARGRLAALELWTDAAGGRRVTRRAARRWWRRRRPLVEHVERSLAARR